MNRTVRVSPPNSVVLVSDALEFEVPKEMGRALVAATASCLAVGTRAPVDGETELYLCSRSQSGEPTGVLVFDGDVETASGSLVVSSVFGEEWLRASTGPRARVRARVNDASEPDVVCIEVPEQPTEA